MKLPEEQIHNLDNFVNTLGGGTFDSYYSGAKEVLSKRRRRATTGWGVAVILILLAIWAPQFNMQIWLSAGVVFFIALIYTIITYTQNVILDQWYDTHITKDGSDVSSR